MFRPVMGQLYLYSLPLSGLLLSDFPTTILWAFLISCMLFKFPAYLTLPVFDHPRNI
jgi:hypothetical protein